MATTKFYAVNKSLEVKEYATLDSAKRLSPDCIIEETLSIKSNGDYKNLAYDFTYYNGSGEVVKEVKDGQWKLTNLVCYENYYHQKVVISCRVVDPTGRVADVELTESAFEGVMQAIKKLRTFSKFESIENYKLYKENEDLKKENEELKEKLLLYEES